MVRRRVCVLAGNIPMCFKEQILKRLGVACLIKIIVKASKGICSTLSSRLPTYIHPQSSSSSASSFYHHGT